MPRKIKIPKISYTYIGNDSPEQKKRAEEHVNRAFDILFEVTLENIRKEENVKT